MAEYAANGVQRPRIVMDLIYLFSFIAFLAIICPAAADEKASEQISSQNTSIISIASYDISRVVNKSNIIINTIALKDGSSAKEELLLIGEMKISAALKDLVDLSRNNQSGKNGMKLIETRDLAITI